MKWAKQVKVRKIERVNTDRGNFVVLWIEPITANRKCGEFIGFDTNKSDSIEQLDGLMKKQAVKTPEQLTDKVIDVRVRDNSHLIVCI